MVGFGKDKLIPIILSQEEQACILEYCQYLSSDIQNKVAHATDGILYLMENEADLLKTQICYTVQKTTDPTALSILNTLIDKIPISSETQNILERFSRIDPTNPETFQDILDEIENERKFASDPLRGNLTEEQITRFQDYKWGDAEFPLQFNHDLSIEDINLSLFFRNTKLFLNKVMEHKDAPILTPKGNLNRKFVKLMFDEMELDEEDREFTEKYNKVLNEEDVFPLHLIKIICEGAGLIHQRTKKLTIYKKLQYLLSDDNAGELYYRLFDAYINEFNLSYLDRLPEMDAIQGTFDFSLYSIYRFCDKYQSVEDLFYEAFLPSIINEIEEIMTSEYVKKEWFLTSRVIRPLEGFGLVECRYEGDPKRSHISQVKKTALFDKFMMLNL